MWVKPEDSLTAELWPESANMDPEALGVLFEAAHEACMAYAPLLPAGAPIPARFKLAQIMQARHIWTQMAGGNRDEVGTEGYQVAVYPLVFAAQDLLRPKTTGIRGLR